MGCSHSKLAPATKMHQNAHVEPASCSSSPARSAPGDAAAVADFDGAGLCFFHQQQQQEEEGETETVTNIQVELVIGVAEALAL